QWSDNINQTGHENWQSEWEVLEWDLNKISDELDFSEVVKLKKVDKTAWATGQRVLYVPTFYAVGKVR
ncbi:MAG: hypothetical protein ABFS03_00485, partial [Chloroflexota bacterium]